MAPSAAAWVLGLAWRALPGLPETAGLRWLVGAALTVVAAGLWSEPAALRRRHWHWRWRWPSEVPLFWAVLILVLAAVVYLVLRIPPYSNDPLEYAAVARLLHAHRSLAVYPVLDSAMSGGLYAPWTHPPGFPLLMSLLMTTSQIDAGFALKWVAALHVVLCIGGLAVLLPKSMRWVAVLSLMATPVYMIGVINGYVEAVRLTALVGVFAACLALWQGPTWSSAARLGMLFGLCGFVHSLGILSTAFFLPVLVLRREGLLRARVGWGLAIVATQVLVLAPDLWRNITLFGVVLGDRPAIWLLPEIGRAEYFREFRTLVTPADKLVRGWLQGFSQVPHFGFTYWVPLLLAAAMLMRRRREVAVRVGVDAQDMLPMVMLATGVIATFYVLAAVLTLTGSVEAIKNSRYMLTVQPLLALVTAWLVFQIADTGSLRRFICAGLVLCSLVPLVYMAERYPGLLTSDLDRRQAYFIHARPEADAVREVDRLTASGRCALLFQQSDYALYGHGCFRSFLDHRFTEVYRETSSVRAVARLRALSISVIVTPSHAMPEIYNTAVGQLLADPSLSRLIWSEGGFSIYELVEPGSARPILGPSVDVVPHPSANLRLDVEWARIAETQQAGGIAAESGLLCVEASGTGLVDLTTVPPAPERAGPGVLLGFVRSNARYVAASSTRGRRVMCVQQLYDQARGVLRVQASAGVRIERISFSWAVWPTRLAKEN
ncbi:MAG: hypothetical protein ABL900_07985 [Burkholderiaceae bacterium]